MTVTGTDRVHLGQMIPDLDEAYARMRRPVPASGAGPVDPGVLSEAQWEAIHRYDTLAERVRSLRAERRGTVPAQSRPGGAD